MRRAKLILTSIGLIFGTLLLVECQRENLVPYDEAHYETEAVKSTTAGNNLSFPVVWSDGFEKELREPPVFGQVFSEGEWWHVWADDPAEPTDPIFSCMPQINDNTLCEDGSIPGDGVSELYRAYIQKDEANIWQAHNFHANSPLNVDLIDWGDNLESIDWSIKSQIRTEIVLYENFPGESMRQYAMRHVSGWGENEVHGLQTTSSGEPVLGPGEQATVYSHNARLTIQKLNIDRDDIIPGSLTWVPNTGWEEADPTTDIINPAIFNAAVYETDGPDFYSSEINVKGKIIYGYTWNARNLNEGVGYYRVTFSFDEFGGVVPLNTFFNLETEILLPVEELSTLATREDTDRGGEAVVDVENNLTYMDILLVKKIGGGGGGGGGGGTGGGGGGGGTGGGGGGGGH